MELTDLREGMSESLGGREVGIGRVEGCELGCHD
jgi:hypothetical protein